MKLKKKERQLLEKVKEKVFETIISITTTTIFGLLVLFVKTLFGI